MAAARSWRSTALVRSPPASRSAVILAAKFVEGAWLTVIVIPCTIVLLRAVRRYYDEIDRQILTGSRRQIDLRPSWPPLVLVPIKRWDRLARKALEYALRLSPDITALHVIALEGPDGKDQEARLRTGVAGVRRATGHANRTDPTATELGRIRVPQHHRAAAARHPGRPDASSRPPGHGHPA